MTTIASSDRITFQQRANTLLTVTALVTLSALMTIATVIAMIS